MDNFEYVVIQAGGLGSRMGNHTLNKPKCMIPYNGKSIIQHTIDYFKNKKIFIICDYKKELLKSYILDVLKYDVTFVDAKQKSTTSGLDDIYDLLPENEPFIYLWSDLILTQDIKFDFNKDVNVYLTDEILCRWSVVNNKMIKEASKENGVVGIFTFKNKSILKKLNLKESFVGGNIVNFHSNEIGFKKIKGLIEIGTEGFYNDLLINGSKSRFFNDVKISKNVVTKKCIDSNYSSLIDNEVSWYKFLNNKVNFIPYLVSSDPLTMTRIKGKHVFETTLSSESKLEVIKSVCDNLNTLHSMDKKKSNLEDLQDIYINKTIDRVFSVKGVIPFFTSSHFFVNGVYCINPFYKENITDLINDIKTLLFNDSYGIIHGDPTFSNILINSKNETFLIDPRGIFGKTKIYGDCNYDWAKLYYSVNGNYDSINSKSFSVKIEDNKIDLKIKSNGFEEFSEIVLKNSNMSKKQMTLHQSLIWLSLTGYVKEDYDSILYSFFYGVLLWNLMKI
jgi:GTP:adenosylcobinamide-phosphate guanylyltransferase/thiamine kinase-like enzyme